ncbi:heme-binding protein [Rhodococcus rhodnii]|uniref:CDP-alcohol phosphatidyltransferase n=2 Tax=Rhodococcus rhodnii TaxID=38312 RepID=R7WJ56_9NOCA|nr:heme-binding protein [Rhodococcus rhodnii]EOM75283.1 hypothetical protein Rrhod_3418 [Rhodococcus rhodnii LMG 5362]TXG92085.1 heme-binding protein [Rhodococcus rhodnii]
MHRILRITLDDALPILAAGAAKAAEIGVRQTLCVCDDSGNVIALHRLPHARITGVEIAMAKAYTAAGHERATHLFNEPPNGPALPGNEAFGISHMLPGKFAIFVGGFPLVHEGQVVGGVGISGGNGEQDKAVGAAMLAEFDALASAGVAETCTFDVFHQDRRTQ